MKMNKRTKLVFALEHIAHLHDLIEDNEWEEHLKESLITMEVELERQLHNELEKVGEKWRNSKIG
tara:strand:+ start:817 stop:1011 length:195 start_codon:yes stop_codon:yes gene_type:complete